MNALPLYAVEGLLLALAVSLILTRNVLYAALLVVGLLACIAVIYFLLGAEFLGATQLLVYAGGILVIMLFGIMLTSKLTGQPLRTEVRMPAAGMFAGILLFAMLAYGFARYLPTAAGPAPKPTRIETVGVELMTDYLLPFEWAGVLLLIALVGAASTVSALHLKDRLQ